ncbi:MAG: Asp-tRNA(Asn)/Glu-tRNA(Gln) amidotransferase subunit GatC [bacterium]
MVNSNPVISLSDVQHTAQLANLPIPEDKLPKLQAQLESILQFVKTVQTVDTDNVPETTQVTGLENVWRKDEVEDSRTFTQDEALANASSTHNGFFMVKAVI